MSYLHTVKLLRSERREVVEMGYVIDSPELFSSSGYFGPSLPNSLLQEGSCRQA